MTCLINGFVNKGCKQDNNMNLSLTDSDEYPDHTHTEVLPSYKSAVPGTCHAWVAIS